MATIAPAASDKTRIRGTKPPTRVLFLELTGCLNSWHWILRDEVWKEYQDWYRDPPRTAADAIARRQIDPACAGRLARIVTCTDAKVVIASHWTCQMNPGETQKALVYYTGISSSQIIGSTTGISTASYYAYVYAREPGFTIGISPFQIISGSMGFSTVSHHARAYQCDPGFNPNRVREFEIRKWLRQHPSNNLSHLYLGGSGEDFSEETPAFFSDVRYGLTDNDVDTCIRILNQEVAIYREERPSHGIPDAR